MSFARTSDPGGPTNHAGRRVSRMAQAALVSVAVIVAVIAVAINSREVWLSSLWSPFGDSNHWGEVESTVPSADGSHAAVVYRFDAMIDPGWVVALRSGDGSEREWVWRSVELVSPESVRFTSPSTLEVVGSNGVSYTTDYDESTLAPVERYCLTLEYCYSAPWDRYTKSGP